MDGCLDSHFPFKNSFLCHYKSKQQYWKVIDRWQSIYLHFYTFLMYCVVKILCHSMLYNVSFKCFWSVDVKIANTCERRHRESKKGENDSLLVSASWLLWCWTSVHTYKDDQCIMKNKRGGPEIEGWSLMPPIPQLFWPICCVNYSDSKSFWTETSCNFEVTERSVLNINNFYYRASWPPNEIALFLTTTKSGLLEKYWH